MHSGAGCRYEGDGGGTIQAIKGDYGLVLQRFNCIAHSQRSDGSVLDELLLAHKVYLPQFGDVIQQLEEQGRNSG
ncbi:MAG: hypothetical protein ACLT16_10520 [[Clostridium] innocuum]